jgi:hypothetical protein
MFFLTHLTHTRPVYPPGPAPSVDRVPRAWPSPEHRCSPTAAPLELPRSSFSIATIEWCSSSRVPIYLPAPRGAHAPVRHPPPPEIGPSSATQFSTRHGSSSSWPTMRGILCSKGTTSLQGGGRWAHMGSSGRNQHEVGGIQQQQAGSYRSWVGLQAAWATSQASIGLPCVDR